MLSQEIISIYLSSSETFLLMENTCQIFFNRIMYKIMIQT